jgi:hypothetical protein
MERMTISQSGIQVNSSITAYRSVPVQVPMDCSRCRPADASQADSDAEKGN